jgi:hypothetical protein
MHQPRYVLNPRPGNEPAMLRRTTCHLIYYPASPEYGDFRKKTKMGFPDVEAAEAWAKQRGVQFVLCSSCDV